MSFLGEIKRRKVFQVAAVYLVVAWLIMQVVDVVSGPLLLPDWFARVVILLLAIGLPIALVLSWAFDLTPQGVVRDGGDAVVRGRRIETVLVGLLALAVSFLVVDRYLLPFSEGAASIASGSGSASPIRIGTGQPIRRFSILLDSVETVGDTEVEAHFAISPDARTLVYAARTDGVDQLFLRRLDELEAEPIPGTEGAHHPCISEDGESVAFYSDTADKKLKVVQLAGGQPRDLIGSEFPAGCAWSAQGDLVFSLRDGSLRYFSGGVGAPEIMFDSGADNYLMWPELLPDDRGMLFTVRPVGGSASAGRIDLLSFETGEARPLIDGGYRPRYAPTGHIVFARDASLWAVPFDLEELEITGSEAPVLDRLQVQGNIGASSYDFADDGTLVYIPGIDVWQVAPTRLIRVSRDGLEQPVPAEPQVFGEPAVSPDGSQVAIEVSTSGNTDIWVYDLDSGRRLRLTTDSDGDFFPRWTPDGERIVFGSLRGDAPGLYVRAANATGPVEHLTSGNNNLVPESFTADGTSLVFREGIGGLSDLYLLSLDDFTVDPLIVDPALDLDRATVSPDGNWIAYTSNETGSFEVYVLSFPELADRQAISVGGGHSPRWSSAGSELYYRNGQDMMVVPVELDPEFLIGNPSVMFREDYLFFENCCGNYDLAPDGSFLMLKDDQSVQERGISHLVVVENWFEELERLVPTE